MLKSILFLLVLISFITTPTRAYEAYDNLNLVQIKEATKQELKIYQLCEVAVAKAEKKYGIKQNLLQTIASVESGRWNEEANKRVAWPWTVHANGKGQYYNSKTEAINAVRDLQSKGITNIDIGCMQVNLKYHGKAFSSLEEAFEPEKNVAYSAKFLQQLYRRNQYDWKKTAMRYHSNDWRKGVNYKNRLEKHYAQYIRIDNPEFLF